MQGGAIAQRESLPSARRYSRLLPTPLSMLRLLLLLRLSRDSRGGLVSPPRRAGDGFRCWWVTGCGVVVRKHAIKPCECNSSALLQSLTQTMRTLEPIMQCALTARSPKRERALARAHNHKNQGKLSHFGVSSSEHPPDSQIPSKASNLAIRHTFSPLSLVLSRPSCPPLRVSFP